MSQQFDVAVVGLGAMGSAARSISRAAASAQSASTGFTRHTRSDLTRRAIPIIRQAYYEDPALRPAGQTGL